MIKQIILEYENFTYLNRLSKLVGVPPNPISDKSLRENNRQIKQTIITEKFFRRKYQTKILDENFRQKSQMKILDENLRQKF